MPNLHYESAYPSHEDATFGISVIEYFAARAPYPPPKWFTPATEPCPPDDIRDEDAQDDWKAMVERERALQWPLYWAVEMATRTDAARRASHGKPA